MHENRMRLMTTNNLTVGYRSNPLLNDLNLALKSHELVCFMGPNGIGKSTLIRTLAGLHEPLRGSVSLDIQPQQSIRTEQLVSVVLTDRITASNMTVEELITFGRYPYTNWSIHLDQADQKMIDEAMELARVAHLRKKRLFELSDGQMQMTMIARALAQNTPLLLLDEPTAHLDLNNRVEIMNLLRKLTRINGKSILIATHELDLALQTADVIWLAGRNKNILTGIPEDLVLNGSFDDIFQLKGFDLKTGKVWHEPWRGVSLKLIGGGHEYLWTKNALERTGFAIDNNATEAIIVEKESNIPAWKYKDRTFTSVEAMLNEMERR